MTRNHSRLDTEELLLLATRATRRGDTKKAAQTLRQVLDRKPDHALAHLLLGGLYASAGQRDKAVQSMGRAVELDPAFASARFQLGLLYLTSGEVQVAERVWQPLQDLGDENPFHLFARGMLSLVRDEFANCVADIEAGIERNAENPALNREMARFAERAREAGTPSPEVPTG
jgi:Flp pilus assembly protein TadD